MWLWTGTAEIPEKPEKDVGLGLTLPIYVSGPSSVGWWAMFITMIGDLTAFVSLVFGYFFYWTARPDFPPEARRGLVCGGPCLALVLLGGRWLLTVMARRWNGMTAGGWFYVAMAAAVAAGGSGLRGAYCRSVASPASIPTPRVRCHGVDAGHLDASHTSWSASSCSCIVSLGGSPAA